MICYIKVNIAYRDIFRCMKPVWVNRGATYRVFLNPLEDASVAGRAGAALTPGREGGGR